MIYMIRLSLFLLVFIQLFFTKIHVWYADIPFLFLVGIFIFHGFTRQNLTIPKEIIYLAFAFIILMVYAMFICLVNGAVELFWFIKLGRMAVFIVLMYFFYDILSKRVSYEEFKVFVIGAVILHSFVIYVAMYSNEFKWLIYSFTGYVPRGPEWSRTPGLTHSFNSPAIVHLMGILLIVKMNGWSIYRKLFLALLIVPSFMFLGRSMGYLGLALIAGYMIFTKLTPRSSLLVCISLVLLLNFFSLSEKDIVFDQKNIDDDISQQWLANLNGILLPLMRIGDSNSEGADSYYETLSDHIYFSENPFVIIFGNSHTGPSGLSGGYGETGSDIGIINSINANGVFVTFFLYLIYFYLTYRSKGSEWFDVFFVAILSIALTFKEMGFWASHATPLLLLIFYYQAFPCAAVPRVNSARAIKLAPKLC